MAQFSGYTIWSYLLRTYVYQRHAKQLPSQRQPLMVPLYLYLGLSLLRAVDLGMTNLAMQYVNYPAKTLMKSSRVVFTMLFGVLIARKRYRLWDYVVVLLMVSGLAIFMHADANSSAIFHSLGIIMLVSAILVARVVDYFLSPLFSNSL
jgi:drug/metabolite transporter (DMT)-like permease